MAMDTESQASGRAKIDIFWEKMKRLPGLTWKTVWKVGRDDRRRVIHSLKVGLSLTLVSLLYLMEPLFKGVGENAIWAVMTVVVVFEFTAGATLCKGLNRGIGTLLAGLLAFLIKYIAEESGRVFRAIFIGAAVFFIGTASTYTRFIPYIKKNYDYGVLIFLLTFNLITLSSYRVENVLKMAHERFYTIAIGCSICLFMTLLVFPIWSGEDLHNSTVSKLEGLAKSIEACVYEFFSDEETKESKEKSSEDPIYKDYKKVLDSKSNDETLALHASWEPWHSRHCRYPWQQYVKLGVALRQFGYTIVALHGCLQTEIQTPGSVRALFKDPCTRLATEVSKTLRELAESIKNRSQCSPEILSSHLHKALQDLNTALKSHPSLFLGQTTNHSTNTSTTTLALPLAAATAGQRSEKDFGISLSSVKTDTSSGKEKKVLRLTSSKFAITSVEFSEALPFAAFASLLLEVVARLDSVIIEVIKLGEVASFKKLKKHDDDDEDDDDDDDDDDDEDDDDDDKEVMVVTCERPKAVNGCNLENHLHSHGAV